MTVSRPEFRNLPLSFPATRFRVIASIAAIMSFAGCRTPAGNGLAESHMTPRQCAEAFKKGEWVNLFAGDDVMTNFDELPDRGSPNGGWIFRDHHLTSMKGGPYSHLVTRCAFENFEMEFQWTVTPGANSGVKYMIDPTSGPVGLEYQILDDALHPDALVGPHRQAGALYDLIAPDAGKKLNPPGSVNTSRIVFTGNRGEHWLNGIRVVSFDLESADFKKAVSASKFKSIPGYGVKRPGSILIQHHGDEVIFQSLRVKAL